jgi:hypothetical protein
MVKWSIIRMVNTLAAMHNLKIKTTNFTQAFPHAKLKEDIYLWFLKLSDFYEKLGFKKSKSDPFLFLQKDMIIVLYTDDCNLYARDTTDIDKFVKTLRDDY